MRDRFLVVVHLIVAVDDRVLLLRRAGTGRADHFWAPPGGHLEHGEWPLEAALRECAEEAGLVVPAERAAQFATLAFRDPQDAAPGFNLLFAARLDRAPALRPDPACASEAAWCDPGALPEPAVSWLPEALARRAAIAALGAGGTPWYGERR